MERKGPITSMSLPSLILPNAAEACANSPLVSIPPVAAGRVSSSNVLERLATAAVVTI